MKILILNFCLLLCFASCAKKIHESSRIIQPQTGETEGGSGGGSAGGTTGGSTGGSEGGSTDGSEGGSTGGSEGGSTGGSEGGSTGGSEGGSTGGSGSNIRLFVGNSADAHSGFETTGFSESINPASAIQIDFKQFNTGKYSTLGTLTDNKFEFSVGAEKLSGDAPAINLESLFGTKTYKFKVENPVSQNGTNGIESGIETKSGLLAIKRITGIWKFAKPISFWGASLIDVESSENAQARLRLFDCSSNLIEEREIVYPDGENGNKQIHFVGFVSDEANVCSVSLTVGDYSFIGGIAHGLFRAIAIDDFVFGE